jgi:hypothetical protein
MRLKLTVFCFYVVCWLAALAFFAAGSPQSSDSKVIKLDINGERGVVLFDHKAHEGLLNPDSTVAHKARQGAACIGCHHTSDRRGIPQLWRCGACHRQEGHPQNPKNSESDEVHTERAFHDTCIGCHRASNQTTRSVRAPIACGDCHQSVLGANPGGLGLVRQ